MMLVPAEEPNVLVTIATRGYLENGAGAEVRFGDVARAIAHPHIDDRACRKIEARAGGPARPGTSVDSAGPSSDAASWQTLQMTRSTM